MKYFVAECDAYEFDSLILAEDEYDAWNQAANKMNGFVTYDPRELYITPLDEWEVLYGKWEDA